VKPVNVTEQKMSIPLHDLRVFGDFGFSGGLSFSICMIWVFF
jgi:hypothetical protein